MDPTDISVTAASNPTNCCPGPAYFTPSAQPPGRAAMAPGPLPIPNEHLHLDVNSAYSPLAAPVIDID